MSELRDLVLDASKAVLDAQCTPQALDDARNGRIPGGLWGALEETGITRALVSESGGGAGLSVQDAGALVRQSAYYAAPVPLAETILATWLLNAAEIEVPRGALSVGFVPRDGSWELPRGEAEWKLQASAAAVPWARAVSHVVLVLGHDAGVIVALVPSGRYSTRQAINLADEPRDTIAVECPLPADARSEVTELRFSVAYEFGAALRTAQISGALERTLELSVSYAMERKQFGRPLAKFQAVQHNLAMLAGQAAAANGAAELALAVAGDKRGSVAIAAAKARASEAATVGAALAHQVHGAIGVTREYALHHYTQRLLSWRDEFGGEAYWWGELGRSMLAHGAENYWSTVCSVDDAVAGLRKPYPD